MQKTTEFEDANICTFKNTQEENFQQDLELACALSESLHTIPHEIEFARFQIEYQKEVKENYLLKNLIQAIEKIQHNQKICKYLLKQIEAHSYIQYDKDLDKEVHIEIEHHLKILKTSFNTHYPYSEDNWESLHLCLSRLSPKDIAIIKNML